MLGRKTLTPQYWTDDLTITEEDLEAIFSVMLEEEEPLDGRQMVRLFVERRVRLEEETWRKRLADGQLFQPRAKYEVGQKLVFPAMSFALGEVVGTRPGANTDQGNFTVIQVEFEDGSRREFASELQAPHRLNLEDDVATEDANVDADRLLPPVDIDAIVDAYGDDIRARLEERLSAIDDVAYAAGLWFLKSLLPSIDQGHKNLAEALLDMQGGGPLAAEDMLPVLDLPAEINPKLQAFALNYALYNDKRFDEVGPAGLVRWFLREMEPDEVKSPPDYLHYEPIAYNPDLLTDEERELEAEIADELSPLPRVKAVPDAVTLTLIYPHRRAGTLPLTPQLSAMFPTAYEAERILITLEDADSGEEYTGWVVRSGRYVCGLDRYYRKHKLPIGVYVQVRRTDDPGRFLISFDGYRARTEWVTLLQIVDGRVTFQTQQRAIGAAYDDLMALGVDDLQGLDQIWQTIKRQRRGLVDTVRELLPELARLNPQGAVHFKTLYSAVNMVRRCPPGPIFAALEAQPEFEPVGGHYWRFNREA
ncbi:MAG: hypothetical protein Kow0077_10190 [Anaerolineae bacterium]